MIVNPGEISLLQFCSLGNMWTQRLHLMWTQFVPRWTLEVWSNRDQDSICCSHATNLCTNQRMTENATIHKPSWLYCLMFVYMGRKFSLAGEYKVHVVWNCVSRKFLSGGHRLSMYYIRAATNDHLPHRFISQLFFGKFVQCIKR